MSCPVRMQLPDELERIVRDFSKPLLRYPQEYKLAVVANKKEWPELKKKLSSPGAEQVLPELRAYLETKNELHAYLVLYNKTVVQNPACELSQAEQHDMLTKVLFLVSKELNCRRKLVASIA